MCGWTGSQTIGTSSDEGSTSTREYRIILVLLAAPVTGAVRQDPPTMMVTVVVKRAASVTASARPSATHGRRRLKRPAVTSALVPDEQSGSPPRMVPTVPTMKGPVECHLGPHRRKLGEDGPDVCGKHFYVYRRLRALRCYLCLEVCEGR